MNKTIETGEPKTLMQAHHALVRIRPSRDASLPAWFAYYQRSASVYEQIAKIDPKHDGEALYWAQRERARADNIAERIRARPG
ncbi:MAG TPA: AMED_5909 family protein [Pseudonocardiaceae bacterium]|jgi:hypothetical protein|nr:AMED_5909 family protein [Pseudonocardiaceae bacterium]